MKPFSCFRNSRENHHLEVPDRKPAESPRYRWGTVSFNSHAGSVPSALRPSPGRATAPVSKAARLRSGRGEASAPGPGNRYCLRGAPPAPPAAGQVSPCRPHQASRARATRRPSGRRQSTGRRLRASVSERTRPGTVPAAGARGGRLLQERQATGKNGKAAASGAQSRRGTYEHAQRSRGASVRQAAPRPCGAAAQSWRRHAARRPRSPRRRPQQIRRDRRRTVSPSSVSR